MELSSNSPATLFGSGTPPWRSSIRKSTPIAARCALDSAVRHLAHGDARAAYDGLVLLANAGDVAAARMALLMSTRGPRLFGQTFRASTTERERWLRLSEGGADERPPSAS